MRCGEMGGEGGTPSQNWETGENPLPLTLISLKPDTKT